MNALTEAIPDESQRLALTTWYQPDDPRYLDPRHPLIKLAGEAGEILDLFGKHEYKPGFDWWDCKHCGMTKDYHTRFMCDKGYNPKVLDELGDFWYYLRIITWQRGISTEEWLQQRNFKDWTKAKDTGYMLAEMANNASEMLLCWYEVGNLDIHDLRSSFDWFIVFLSKLDTTLDRLTELNYQKLNSEPSAHGWKNV